MRSFFLNFRGVVLLSLSLSLFLFSCGGGEEGDNYEIVYLRIFNGYPGTTNLSLYGPTGTVITGLPFGKGSEGAIAVDRSLGTDFTLILDGVPEPIDLTPELYSLYPHETATLFIVRRTDASTADFKLYRHIQAISPACRILVDNNLSVANQAQGLFNFISGWHFPVIDNGGYSQSFESDIIDGLNAETPACMDLTQFKRDQYFTPSLFSQISDHPYFAVEIGGEQEIDFFGNFRGLQWVWIGEEDYVDIPRVDFTSGTLVTHRTSNDFLICMREAAEAVDPDDECDPGWDAPFIACLDQQTQSVLLHTAGDASSETFVLHYYPETIGNPPNVCDAEIRIFSDFGNIFQGEHGYDGYNNNTRVDFSAEFGLSDHFFYVLYGRPVNPKGAAWKASVGGEDSGGFVDLPPYPGE